MMSYSTIKHLLEYETFTDANGITWNDEGDGTDRAGNQYVRRNGQVVRVGGGPPSRFARPPARRLPRPPAAPSVKIFHSVPFRSKDEAKAEGMRWDPDSRRWYHTDPDKSAKSTFPKTPIDVLK